MNRICRHARKITEMWTSASPLPPDHAPPHIKDADERMKYSGWDKVVDIDDSPDKQRGYCIKDVDGSLKGFCRTRAEVERNVVGTYYNPEALTSERMYRRLFDEQLTETLQRDGFTIVPCELTLTEVEQ